MIIVAIAWIYVVLMMAITEPTVIAGIMTFLMYCVLPLAIILYLARSPGRKKQRKAEMLAKMEAGQNAPAAPETPAESAPGMKVGRD